MEEDQYEEVFQEEIDATHLGANAIDYSNKDWIFGTDAERSREEDKSNDRSIDERINQRIIDNFYEEQIKLLSSYISPQEREEEKMKTLSKEEIEAFMMR
jgi:hypothetical protein